MKYAIIITISEGDLLETTAAIINGIAIYENEVDICLIPYPNVSQEYLNGLPDYVKIISWNCVKDENRYNLNQDKSSGWECRFYRYKVVEQLKDKYEGLMICDADMQVLGNIMEYFDLTLSTGKLLMPDNPIGIDDSFINKTNIDLIKTACSPAYHNMPLFFDSVKYAWLMKEVYETGIKEPYGDMATLYRTIVRNDLRNEVRLLDNRHWIYEKYYLEKIKKECDEKLKLSLSSGRILMNHRRWNCEKVRQQCLKIGNKENEIARHNIEILYESIKWLNNNGPFEYYKE